jgi:hypothetical protein
VRVRKRWATLTGLLGLVSCLGAGSSDPFHLEAVPLGANTRLTLLAAPGLKLNARLKPALELTDGRVLRFDSPRLTADSAYFAEPPSAIAIGRRAHWRGKLRASVCDAGETICRTVVQDL